ncbi:MAG: ABC transporter permease, partial [Blastocatellia bacterium]|nr:ABC transporter permease [Blastocatellia bacterium]
MSMLNRKLIRDLLHMRGQIIAITLVAACGIAAFICLRNIYQSLLITQDTYYSSYRFANVFVQVKRAPDSIKSSIEQIPGVATVQTRIVSEVTLDVPGLNEPGSARLISIPEKQVPILNDLHLTSGRWISPNNRNEVIISVAFAEKNQFKPGDSISAIINGRWTKLNIVGLALSPEFIYEIRGGEMFPDSRRFAVIWMGDQALGAAFNMQGAFNDVVLSLSPQANETAVIEKLDLLLENYGSLGAYGREDQISHHFVSNEIAELKVNGTLTPALFL